MSTTLNTSFQLFRAIGFVNEIDLKQEDCEITIKDSDGNETKMDSERIRGRVAVRINNGIKTFDVFCSKHTSKGAESKTWKNALAMLDLIPEIGRKTDESPSKVMVNGRIAENRYFSENTHDVATNIRWNATRITTSRVSEDAEEGCTLTGNFYIKSIKPEIKNEEETGNLIVTLCGVQYGATPFILETIVEEDLAEAFEDLYEVGQTVSFDIDVVFEHVGGTNQQKKAFGTSGAIKSVGFDREKLIIVGGNEPIEDLEQEDENGNLIDNGYIDPKAMKAALKERDIALEEIKNNQKTETHSNKKSLKDKKKTLGKRVSSPVEDDDTDPFDEDEDF